MKIILKNSLKQTNLLQPIAVILLLISSLYLNAATINIGSNGCTLRDAIRSANADAPRGNCPTGSGSDILISPDVWAVSLNSTLPTITSDMTIRTATINGQLTITGNDNHRIMKVTGVNTGLTLSRVNLIHGSTSALEDNGAGIRIIDASVNIFDSILTANESLGGRGGAIFIRDGLLTIQNSVIGNNYASKNSSNITFGGAIYSDQSVINILDSAFSNNLARYNHHTINGVTSYLSPGRGDSIYLDSSELIMSGSLVSQLSTGIEGSQSIVDISNSTILKIRYSQTESTRPDHFSFRNNSVVTLRHNTIKAPIRISDSTLSMTNTILEGNCDLFNTDYLLSAGNLYHLPNPVYNTLCEGEPNIVFHTQLMALTDNGGPTRTLGIDFRSPAVNMGDQSYCLPTDQRGEPRDALCDVGAFEVTDIGNVRVSSRIVETPPYVFGQTITYVAIIENISARVVDHVNITLTRNNASFISTNSLLCPSFPCVINELQPGQELEIPVVIGLSGPQANFSMTLEAGTTVDSTYVDSNLSNNIDLYEYFSLVHASDMAVEMELITAPPYFNGQVVQYNVVATNHGASTAAGVEFTFNPVGLDSVSFSGCVSVNGLVCSLNNLFNGGTDSVSVNATINAQEFDAVGSVDSVLLDINLDNNIDDRENNGALTEADVQVNMSISQPAPYHSFMPIDFEIIMKSGSDPVNNVRLWYEFNGEVLNVDYCAGVTPCQLPDIAANTTLTLSAQFLVPNLESTLNDGTFTFSVLVTAGQADPDLSNNEVFFTSAIQAAADISNTLDRITAGPYYVGQEIEYQLRTVNSGINHASDVNINVFAQNLTLLWSAGNLCSTVNCTVANFARFTEENITLVYRIDSEGSFHIESGAFANETDPNPSNNSDNSNNDGVAILIQSELMFVDGFE